MNRLSKILAGVLALCAASATAAPPSDPYQGYEEAAYMDMDLEQNLLCPAVDAKEHAAVKRYMGQIGRDLAKKGYIVDTMREGEVLLVTVPSDNLFLPNDTLLSPAAPAALQPVLALLADPYMYKVVYAVHTDDTGSPKYNMALAHERNNSVYDWLLSKVSEDQIVIPYELGDTDPVEKNDTRKGRAANRRLEIYLVPGPKLITQAKKGLLK